MFCPATIRKNDDLIFRYRLRAVKIYIRELLIDRTGGLLPFALDPDGAAEALRDNKKLGLGAMPVNRSLGSMSDEYLLAPIQWAPLPLGVSHLLESVPDKEGDNGILRCLALFIRGPRTGSAEDHTGSSPGTLKNSTRLPL